MLGWKLKQCLLMLFLIGGLIQLALTQAKIESEETATITATATIVPDLETPSDLVVEPSLIPSATAPDEIIGQSPSIAPSTPTFTNTLSVTEESIEQQLDITPAIVLSATSTPVSDTSVTSNIHIETPTATAEFDEQQVNMTLTPTLLFATDTTLEIIESVQQVDGFSNGITEESDIFTEVPAQSPTLATPVATLPGITPARVETTVDTADLMLGDKLVITMYIKRLVNVYSVATICQVNPTILGGSQLTLGSQFTSADVEVRNSGFQQDGQWVFAATGLSAGSTVNEGGILWQLEYEVINIGQSSINCTVSVTDSDGRPLLLNAADIELAVVNFPTAVSPTSTQAAHQLNDNPIITPTVNSTVVEVATNQSTLSGHIILSNPSLYATITISDIIIKSPSTAPFSVNLPSGEYQLSISAPQHLPVIIDVTLGSELEILPAIHLINGDVNSDGVIDKTDIDLVAHNLGQDASQIIPSADLNGDGQVNIRDLVLVSAHLDLSR